LLGTEESPNQPLIGFFIGVERGRALQILIKDGGQSRKDKIIKVIFECDYIMLASY